MKSKRIGPKTKGFRKRVERRRKRSQEKMIDINLDGVRPEMLGKSKIHNSGGLGHLKGYPSR